MALGIDESVQVLLDGIRFNANEDQDLDACYWPTGIAGWWTRTAKNQRTPKPTLPGSYRAPNPTAEKIISLAGFCVAPSASTRSRAENRLQALCPDPNLLYRMEVTEEDGTKFRTVEMVAVDVKRVNETVFSYTVQVAAIDPMKYSTTLQSATSGLPAAGSLGLDWNEAEAANAISNSSFETNTTGWSGLNASTLSRVAGGSVGSFNARSTSTTIASNTGIQSSGTFAVVEGRTYKFTADVKPSAAMAASSLSVNWFDAGAIFISSTSTSTGAVASTTTWTTLQSANLTPPRLAAFATVTIDCGTVAVAQFVDIDNVLFQPIGLDWQDPTGLDWGVPGTNGVMALLNSGTAPAWPVLTISAGANPLVNPVITDQATGRQLRYTGTLLAGNVLIIDTSPFARTVLLGSADRRPFLTKAEWFPIPANSSGAVVFTADVYSATAMLTAEWRNTYF